MNRFFLKTVLWAVFTLPSSLLGTSSFAADTTDGSAKKGLNPTFFYYFNGQTIGQRGFAVSDPDNWSGVQAQNFSAISSGKKVEMKPTDYQATNDAIRVTWSRKNKKGSLTLNGPATDLSKYKDLTAITFEVKVNTRPSKDVQLGLDCGWPCRAEVSIARQLREFKKDEWSIFWMPLNCFSAETFDLSKISGTFLSTDGKMDLSIANIRLERLPDGFNGCQDK